MHFSLPKMCTLVLTKSFALFLAKKLHLSSSPLEWRWVHTFRCQKTLHFSKQLRHHCRANLIGDEFCTSPCQKCAPWYWRRVLRYSSPKNLRLSFFPLEWRWVHTSVNCQTTLHFSKQFAFFALSNGVIDRGSKQQSKRSNFRLHRSFSSKYRKNRKVLQSEIRMQIFVKLGLRTHESSDGPANRHVVLQTENWSFCSIGLLIMALAAGGVWSFDRSVWQPSFVVCTVWDSSLGWFLVRWWWKIFALLSSPTALSWRRWHRRRRVGSLLFQPANAKSSPLPVRTESIPVYCCTMPGSDRSKSDPACLSPKSKRWSTEHHRSPNLDGKKMLANPVERKEPTEPPFWTSWTTGFTSRKSDLETKNLFAKKAVHTNFRVDIREHAPFFRTSSPGLYENCNFRFAKRP